MKLIKRLGGLNMRLVGSHERKAKGTVCKMSRCNPSCHSYDSCQTKMNNRDARTVLGL